MSSCGVARSQWVKACVIAQRHGWYYLISCVVKICFAGKRCVCYGDKICQSKFEIIQHWQLNAFRRKTNNLDVYIYSNTFQTNVIYQKHNFGNMCLHAGAINVISYQQLDVSFPSYQHLRWVHIYLQSLSIAPGYIHTLTCTAYGATHAWHLVRLDCWCRNASENQVVLDLNDVLSPMRHQNIIYINADLSLSRPSRKMYNRNSVKFRERCDNAWPDYHHYHHRAK